MKNNTLLKTHTVIRPKVSVVIPVFNVKTYLYDCLESVLHQTLKEIEIICVDDHSEDGSATIIRQFAEIDSRFVTIFHKENLGTSQSRKDGVAISKGKYIMFLDGDDELTPDACELAYNSIEKHCTDMVQFDTQIVNCSNVPETRIQMNQKLLRPHLHKIQAANLIFPCWSEKKFGFSLWNKVYDGEICRKAFKKVSDGFFPKAQDLYAFFLIAYYSKTYIGIKDVLYRYKFGIGITGSNYISTEQFDTLLTEKKVWEAVTDFINSRNEKEKYADILDSIYNHFLNDCVTRCINNLQTENFSEGFQHLVDTWGIEDVICSLSMKYWNNSSLVAEKISEIDYFKYRKREITGHKALAIYYHSIVNGGAQRVVAELCNLLANMQCGDDNYLYNVVLITDENADNQNTLTEYFLDSKVQRAYLPHFSRHIKDKYKSRYCAWKKIINKFSIDVVISGMWLNNSNLWDMLTVKSHPSKPAFIMHCHSFLCVPFRSQSNKFVELMYDYKICDGAIVLSEVDKKFVSCFAKHSKCINNPLTFSAKTTISTKRCKDTIVWVGRISDEKQPLDVVYMMKHVVNILPDAKLYLIGQGDNDLYKDIESLIKQYNLQNNILLIGFTMEVEKYYQIASVLVGTSQYEGFPLVFCEAMAHGIPIVTYDLPWLTLVRDGRGIITVPQGRSDLLADKIIELLQNPGIATQIGANGKQQVLELKNVDIGADWQSFLDELDSNTLNNKNISNDMESILFKYMISYSNIGRSATKKRLYSKINQLANENKKNLNHIRKLENRNWKLRNSITFRIGKAIMWLPRKIYKRLANDKT